MNANYPPLEPLFEIKLEYKESTPPVSLEGKGHYSRGKMKECASPTFSV